MTQDEKPRADFERQELLGNKNAMDNILNDLLDNIILASNPTMSVGNDT